MSQTTRKFIEDNAVNGAKIRLDNAEMLRSRNTANTGDINILKVNSADKIELQALPEVLATLPMPSTPKQLVTIEYIKNYVIGKTDAKDSVQALSDISIPLTGTAPLVIDGVTLMAATPIQRVGLVGQTMGSQNGIYDYSEAGGIYTLTRSADFDEAGEATNGAYFLTTGGTVYQGYEALLTTSDPIVIGTTSLTFAKYPSTLSLVGGDMLAKTGNVFSVDLAPLGGLESTNAGNVSGQVRVKVDPATLEKDKSTRLDPATGAVMAVKARKAAYTLTATDITNQYVDLSDVAHTGSVVLVVAGAGSQLEVDDFNVNYTGGTSSKTRVTFAGGLAAGGVSALVSGDKIAIYYTAF